jgi:hypothetical protein
MILAHKTFAADGWIAGEFVSRMNLLLLRFRQSVENRIQHPDKPQQTVFVPEGRIHFPSAVSAAAGMTPSISMAVMIIVHDEIPVPSNGPPNLVVKPLIH